MSKLICIDFDGVLHSYTSPWVNESHIPDPPVDGAVEFVRDLFANGCKVAIFSTRNSSPDAIPAMKEWLIQYGLESSLAERITFPLNKPAFGSLFIDDRGYHFTGTFPSIEYCKTFQPWNKR